MSKNKNGGPRGKKGREMEREERGKKSKVWKNKKKRENEAEKEKPQRGCVFLVFLLAFLFASSHHRMKCIERKDFSYSNEAVFPFFSFPILNFYGSRE